ncbi:MAG: type III secretion system export apparatus subunit SctU [Kiritimatiellae bacterium]|nr:type III secretion system export apparatus subunit SctU [Kiritimatiellia bacterium]
MADEGGEKTEMPTPKKLRDARQKGQVCTSKDVVSTAILVVLLTLLGLTGAWLTDDFSQLLKFIGSRLGESDPPQMIEAAKLAVLLMIKHSLLFCCAAAFTGVVGNLVQVGFLFTLEPLKPDLKKLNPAEGAKKIFCLKNVFEFGKNFLKVTFLGYLIYKIILASYPALIKLCYGTIDDIFPVTKVILKNLAGYTIFGYVVIAVVDRLFQQRNFTKQMMMTKDEVKREYKEMEGSQEVKQAQRQFRDEILNGPPPQQATKQADVVVTNPTHYAVGIRFRPDEAPLPKVVVSGADLVAKIIRDTALAEGIPIMENVPLARALYAKVKAEEFVPVDLAEPVAEVLKWVKALNDARKEEEELDSVSL